MQVSAARTAPRRRGGYRLIIILLVVLIIIGAAFFWLNTAASASTNAAAALTVFQPTVSVSRSGGSFVTSATGTVVQPGDSVKTDAKGRASIQLPDGTLTRMAGGTEIALTTAHFARSGNLHDASILQKVGRTFTNVQHLVSGAVFKVGGQSAVASVRGTKFEVLVNPDGSMIVNNLPGIAAGPAYTQAAVETVLPGFGATFVALALMFFAFTTIVAYYYMAETNVQYINRYTHRPWITLVLRCMIMVSVGYGAMRSASTAWDLGDMGVGLMAWLNIIAILILQRPALLALLDYEAQKKQGLDPVFDPDKLNIKNADLWRELNRPD